MSAELLEDRLSEARSQLQALAAWLTSAEGSAPAAPVELPDDRARSRVLAAAAVLLPMLDEADLQALDLARVQGWTAEGPAYRYAPEPEVRAAALETLASLAMTMASEARGGAVVR